MNLASIDTFWLIAALLLLNVFLVTVNHSGNRFWHPPILLWVALFFTLFLLQVGYGYGPEQNAAADYLPSQDNYADALIWKQLEEEKNNERLYKTKTFRLLGAQGFITLLLLTVGYHKNGLLMYRKAAVRFLVICFLYILLEILFLVYGFGFQSQ